jgi:hypothetical protein
VWVRAQVFGLEPGYKDLCAQTRSNRTFIPTSSPVPATYHIAPSYSPYHTYSHTHSHTHTHSTPHNATPAPWFSPTNTLHNITHGTFQPDPVRSQYYVPGVKKYEYQWQPSAIPAYTVKNSVVWCAAVPAAHDVYTNGNEPVWRNRDSGWSFGCNPGASAP